MKNLLSSLIIALLALNPAHLRAEGAEQTLRAGDSIVVKLSGVPAEEIAVVSNSYDISDSGTVNLPYIGEVHAAGTRPSQLQKNIESAYKSAEIFTHPTIQVTPNRIDGANNQVIFVSGEVKTPRAVPVMAGMTTQDALTSAGGPTDFAKLKAVKFTRSGTTKLLDMRKADNPDSQIPVRPGDKIHVPQ